MRRIITLIMIVCLGTACACGNEPTTPADATPDAGEKFADCECVYCVHDYAGCVPLDECQRFAVNSGRHADSDPRDPDGRNYSETRDAYETLHAPCFVDARCDSVHTDAAPKQCAE